MTPPKLEKGIVVAKALAAIRADRGIINPEAFIKTFPVVTYARRGYYRDSMGAAGKNDVGIFDDAAWIVNLQTGDVTPYNWNTDPSKLGYNPGVGRGFAILQPGVYPFCKGQHKGKGAAWRQIDDESAPKLGLSTWFNDFRKDGSFKIWRGQVGEKPETGYFAINIHWGGNSGTSSWGCQTAPTGQWPKYQAKSYAETVGQKIMPYILEVDY